MPAQHRKWITWAVAILVLTLGGGVFGYWQLRKPRLSPDFDMSNGRLEATEVQIASKTAGRLAQVLVHEGDQVTAGQLLARMDTRTLDAQLRQAEAGVAGARQNVAAAQATLQLRQSEQLLARQELRRGRQLYERGYYSAQALDQQTSRLDTATSAVRAARAQVEALQATIGAALAQVASLQSEIDDDSLRAPVDGVIQLRVAEPGEVVAAGSQVLVMINTEDQYMNLYLPTATVGKLTLGDEARIVLDSLADTPLPARISFVEDKAQFTPKEVETRDERQKLVFRVKVNLIDPARTPQAKPGMPGTGYVRTRPVPWPSVLP
ncbi:MULTISPECIES: biotin/lipoyl-binding protein [unclassified Pseudomonas]|uniref:HlyD family secretion protein n=1 Tax=unclassified Pseudomonas TaxID=196821 RepID=UPI000D33558A|nr:MULTISPECIES: biotin/lipoyl-binding protein [unclassified Pseudomonas]RAU42269.1 biotin/lipoyl-binding protein [Pseudomonas sp. RIT 409]RAU55082.1 biotin/lipoyl-binding protein [Pseudomonas sp. RIT 412]